MPNIGTSPMAKSLSQWRPRRIGYELLKIFDEEIHLKTWLCLSVKRS